MIMNLLVWHREPEYPLAHLQTIVARPNRTKVTHVPPLRHGHSIQAGVEEVVGLAVMVEVVVTMEVVVAVEVVVIIEVVVEVVVMVVVEGVGVGRVHISTTGFSLTSFVFTKLLPSES